MEEEFLLLLISNRNSLKQHIYSRQTTTNSSRNRRKNVTFSPHYNSISYCLFEHNLRFSLTHRQSQRKFLVQGTFKIQTKQNKKNVPLLSGVLLTHKHLQKIHLKYTRVEKCGEKKEKIKKLQNTLFIHEAKASIHSH